jgi:hypothetical protein
MWCNKGDFGNDTELSWVWHVFLLRLLLLLPIREVVGVVAVVHDTLLPLQLQKSTGNMEDSFIEANFCPNTK